MLDVYQSDTPAIEAYRHWKWKESVAYIFPHGIEVLLRMRTLHDQEYRVLTALLATVGWGNVCATTLASVARATGMKKQNVSPSMKKLIAARLAIMERIPHEGKYRITLSPEIVWKGRPWHVSFARMAFATEWRLRYGDMTDADVAAGAAVPRLPGSSALTTSQATGGGARAPALPHLSTARPGI